METADVSKVHIYNYIINLLNEYKYYYNQFTSNYKNLIYRLKNFATIKKYKNITELKINLDRRLYKFKRDIDDSASNNFENNAGYNEIQKYNHKLEAWFIIARYMCDFIEDNMAFDKELGFEPVNPIFQTD